LVELFFKQLENILIQVTEDQKHTSLVAKIHYKKRDSRQVAERGKKAVQKLRDQNGSLNAIKTASTTIHFDIKTSTGTIDKAADNVDQATQLWKSSDLTEEVVRKKKVPFSQIEDNYLISGLKKYGKGKWTNILKDSEYKFHPSRKSATLFTRAKLCKFI